MVDPQIGDVLEWQGQPVLVIGDIRRLERYGWAPTMVAQVTYLRDYSNLMAGQVLPQFHIEGKAAWPHELTDEESAIAGQLLLLGELVHDPVR